VLGEQHGRQIELFAELLAVVEQQLLAAVKELEAQLVQEAALFARYKLAAVEGQLDPRPIGQIQRRRPAVEYCVKTELKRLPLGQLGGERGRAALY
jgi:hypothetical protein